MKKLLSISKNLILLSVLFSCSSPEVDLMAIQTPIQSQTVTKNSFEDGSELLKHDKKAQKVLFTITDFGMRATYELVYKVVSNKKILTKFRSYPNGVDIVKEKFLISNTISGLEGSIEKVKAEDKELMREVLEMLKAIMK